MAKVTNKDRFGNPVDPETMIKKFKKIVMKQGILEDAAKHEFFVKKTLKRKMKSENHRRLMKIISK